MESTVQYADDPRIPDEEPQYRTVHPLHIDRDNKKPRSAAFISKRRSDNVHPSVDRSSLSTPEQTLARKPRHVAVAALLAGTVREHNTLGLAWVPVSGNRAHALILRDLSITDSAWKRVAYKLALACRWAISPP